MGLKKGSGGGWGWRWGRLVVRRRFGDVRRLGEHRGGIRRGQMSWGFRG